jgi:hypothetical protein
LIILFPCDVPDPPPECGEEQPGLFENGEELGNEEELRNGEEPEQPDDVSGRGRGIEDGFNKVHSKENF